MKSKLGLMIRNIVVVEQRGHILTFYAWSPSDPPAPLACPPFPSFDQDGNGDNTEG